MSYDGDIMWSNVFQVRIHMISTRIYMSSGSDPGHTGDQKQERNPCKRCGRDGDHRGNPSPCACGGICEEEWDTHRGIVHSLERSCSSTKVLFGVSSPSLTR
jgi:hypothetical protein